MRAPRAHRHDLMSYDHCSKHLLSPSEAFQTRLRSLRDPRLSSYKIPRLVYKGAPVHAAASLPSRDA
jgi:hypothetical protein